MGLTIVLEGHDGGQIEMLDEELYCNDDDLMDHRYKVLQNVDLYGDTVFNANQFGDLITDLSMMLLSLPSQASLIHKIIMLANSNRGRTHVRLTFYGD